MYYKCVRFILSQNLKNKYHVISVVPQTYGEHNSVCI